MTASFTVARCFVASTMLLAGAPTTPPASPTQENSPGSETTSAATEGPPSPEATKVGAEPTRPRNPNSPKVFMAVGVVNLSVAVAASAVSIDAALDVRDIEQRLADARDPNQPEKALSQEAIAKLEDRLDRERNTRLGGSIAAAGFATIGIVLLAVGLATKRPRLRPQAQVGPRGGTVFLDLRF